VTAPPPARALYLDILGEPMFGLLHPPSSDVQHDAAVLICPPFGWEDVCSYRSRREWAERLASAGYPALRIDLPSTGDSGGSPEDPDRLLAWIEAVGSAARWLQSAAARPRVAAIGIGLGGLLACRAAADGAPIDELVLWAVPSRGSVFVRELRAFGRMESSRLQRRSDGNGNVNGQQLPKGYVGAGGFVLSAQTAEALEGMDLVQDTYPAGRPRRVLLLERDGIAVDERLRAHLEQCGVAVRVAPGAGYGAMTAEPQEARPPLEVIASVESWLSEAPAAAAMATRTAATAAPSAATAATLAAGAGASQVLEPRSPAAVPAVVSSDSAELTIDGVRIRETPLSIEQPFGSLFGVLAQPVEATGTQDLGAVLLNAGAIRRIGPNRMWVETARRWAARGVPSLRLDLEGLGDADGDATRFADVAELYVPELVGQVSGAIDVLCARGAARRFVLAGLCSGAYWSFHGALQDERVVAAFMLNPRTLFWNATLENVRYLRRGLFRPSSWRMILHGDVRFSRMSSVARHAPRSVVKHAVTRWRAHGERDQLELALDQLRSRDKRLRFVFSEEEPLHEELERQGRLSRSERWPNLELDLLPGRDHTLRPANSQRRAHDVLDRALEQELARTHV
jgi:pimeloyl-ACP methyl ester carboxylesterase